MENNKSSPQDEQSTQIAFPTQTVTQSPVVTPDITNDNRTMPLNVLQASTLVQQSQPVQTSSSLELQKTFYNKVKISMVILRVGLVFVFTFAALSMSLNPTIYIHYLPAFITNLDVLPVTQLLYLHGFFEIVLSLWLLSGKWSFYAAIIASILMFAITIVNLNSFSTLFRNVGIFTGALALVFLELERQKSK